MKKSVLTIFSLAMFVFTAFAQHPVVSIHDLQYVSPADLAACKDVSPYHKDTVTFTGIVMHDGNLTEVASSSTSVGYRPGVHLFDTAKGAQQGDFNGVQIHGVINGAAITALDNLTAGMIVQVTGIVDAYNNETQVYPLSNSDVKVLGFATPPPFKTIDVAELQDATRTNKLETGEAYEGSFVEIREVTVTANATFSGGTRVSLDVVDKNGNVINISDRFLAGKLRTWNALNQSNAGNKGSLDNPPVGTYFEYIRGIVVHNSNGCTGLSGGGNVGYSINPFDSTHYKIGETPANISEVNRTPLVPKANEAAKISAEIQDFDGTVTEAKLFYTTNQAATWDMFDNVNMTLQSGSTIVYEGTIPGAANEAVVRYYIRATDNKGNLSYSPFNATAATPNFHFYTVRDKGISIVDIQTVLNVKQDASPYVGKSVTVKGIVTASAKDYDLGAIYIQDETAKEWAGLNLTNNSALLDLYRNEEVEATGVIVESFGFTQMSVTAITKTGLKKQIAPLELPVSDSARLASREMEKYESMLVKMVNNGGKVHIANPRSSNFGEYTIASNPDANFINSTRVQAGILNNNNTSSLWVSVISDSSLITAEGELQVPAVKTAKGQTMDAMTGVVYFGFGAYTVKPRNNDDFKNFSEKLDSTFYDFGAVANLRALGVNIYPNPTSDKLNITSKDLAPATISVMSLEGKNLISQKTISGNTTLDVSDLTAGIYFIQYTNHQGITAFSKFVKK